jgi:pentose-5-phosphate-3-epimerase
MKYLCDPHVLPTVVPRDLPHLRSYAESAAAFAQWLHVDIADGIFAPNKTWPYAQSLQSHELEAFSLGELPKNSYEFHLLTHAPHELGIQFAHDGAPRILGHIEAFENAAAAQAALSAWREAGAAEVGLAIKLATPLATLDTAIAGCDFVQLMSISEIGKQGRPFDDAALARVE